MPASQFLMQRSALAGVQAVAARSDRTFARHSHEQFGIGVIRHGAQASHSGRGQVQAQAGQVITVNPGEIHDGAPLGDAGRAWQMLYLDPSVAAEAAREFLPAGEFEFPQPVFDDPVLAGMCWRSMRKPSPKRWPATRCCCACWRARRADAAPPPRHPRPRPSVTPAPASMTIRQPACRWPIWPPPAA